VGVLTEEKETQDKLKYFIKIMALRIKHKQFNAV